MAGAVGAGVVAGGDVVKIIIVSRLAAELVERGVQKPGRCFARRRRFLIDQCGESGPQRGRATRPVKRAGAAVAITHPDIMRRHRHIGQVAHGRRTAVGGARIGLPGGDRVNGAGSAAGTDAIAEIPDGFSGPIRTGIIIIIPRFPSVISCRPERQRRAAYHGEVGTVARRGNGSGIRIRIARGIEAGLALRRQLLENLRGGGVRGICPRDADLVGGVIRGDLVQDVVRAGAFVDDDAGQTRGHGNGHLDIQGNLVVGDAGAAVVTVQQHGCYRNIREAGGGLVGGDVALIEARVELHQGQGLAGARQGNARRIG